MWSWLGKIGSVLFEKVIPRISVDRDKINSSQADINKAEIEGAPMSFFRLWRSILGMVLTIMIIWEIPGRMLIIPMFFPEFGKTLPPSSLEQIITLLMGMLGLNF